MKIKEKVLKVPCGKFGGFLSGWCGITLSNPNPFSKSKRVFVCERCKTLAEVSKVIDDIIIEEEGDSTEILQVKAIIHSQIKQRLGINGGKE